MLTQERAVELFRYDAGVLRRRISRGRFKVGEAVGSVCTDGRLQVKVDGALHYVHRVIYLMHHGWLPEFIDHINRDFTDNRIENLRPATRAENNRNASIRKDNTSGVKGVRLHRNRWEARLTVDNKQHHIGCFSTKEAAEAAIQDARATMHGRFSTQGDDNDQC